MARDVNEVLERAIYGTLETKPAERRLFLTTILERVHLALTTKQVQSNIIYQEAEQTLKSKPNLHLYVNSALGYNAYASYLKLADAYNVGYTIVAPTAPTPFGLVLADKEKPVFIEDPFIKDELHQDDIRAY